MKVIITICWWEREELYIALAPPNTNKIVLTEPVLHGNAG
jgi:hypothetical protein